MIDEAGGFTMMVMERERVPIPVSAPWVDFWVMALMHA